MSRRILANTNLVPPRHTIDLSLPPRIRYKTLASTYRNQLQSLVSLFDELLLSLAIPEKWLPTINKLSRYTLRKVHDSEQTQELRGIADVTGIPMYLLVAFNVVLDLLMGCTSGGVRCLESRQPQTEAKMLHFRTLDWTMDPLRKTIVQLDFVRSKSAEPLRVVASSITYIGFVGVLTGVKPGLSMSLNFRAVHNASTRSAQFRFYLHHLLVLFGRRPSIATLLRRYLLENYSNSSGSPTDPVSVASELQCKHTTAAYIILSDQERTVTMEKDYATAMIQQSSTFIAITNHDKQNHAEIQFPTPAIGPANANNIRQSTGMVEIIEESSDRLDCIERKWKSKLDRARRAQGARTRARRSVDESKDAVDGVCLTQRELIGWICDYPTTNECTHYAAILDPSKGEVVWAVAYPEPLNPS